jgi:HPt (histidine-containing phosphotransfer) domain-containing protein
MTQVSTQELSSLDLSVMAAMRSLGETDVFAEAAGMFLENVPPDLSALSAAIAGGSAASVAQIAHSLRGNALGIGAIRMAPICPSPRARVRGRASGTAGADSVTRTRGRADVDSR